MECTARQGSQVKVFKLRALLIIFTPNKHFSRKFYTFFVPEQRIFNFKDMDSQWTTRFTRNRDKCANDGAK